MPDLGKYAFAVLGSYGVAAALVCLLLVITFWRRARVVRALAEAEARMGKNDV